MNPRHTFYFEGFPSCERRGWTFCSNFLSSFVVVCGVSAVCFYRPPSIYLLLTSYKCARAPFLLVGLFIAVAALCAHGCFDRNAVKMALKPQRLKLST